MLMLKKAFEAPVNISPYHTAEHCLQFWVEVTLQILSFQTLASLVMKIIHGQVAPIDTLKYSTAMEQLLHALLRTIPNERPTAAMLMSHPLICSSVCRVGMDLGRISQE